MGIPVYQKENGEFYDIKAIFVGKRIETDDTENLRLPFSVFEKSSIFLPVGLTYFLQMTYLEEKKILV